MAIGSRAPLVPVGVWGSELVWPRNRRLPYLLDVADPPTVQVRVGRPFHPRSDDPASAIIELMDRIVDLLPPEAHDERTPTETELSATFPRKQRPPVVEPRAQGTDRQAPDGEEALPSPQ